MIGAQFDALMYGGLEGRRSRIARSWPPDMRWLDTAAGRLRLRDTGGDKQPVVFAPDGPCVVEHYDALIELLCDDFRVVCFDLPGFGFSAPSRDYNHRLREGARVIVALLEALDLPPAVLAMSCVNGYYAIAASHLARERVKRLLLAQTPGMPAMRNWTHRVVPSPVQTPLLGQLLSYASRRRIVTAWYRVAVAEKRRCDDFTQVARHNLRQGGCYCFAGVVQGMLATDDADPLLRAPPDLPVTMVWGKRDRSHRKTQAASIRTHCPQAEVVQWDDAGHFPELESPEAYASLLRARCLDT